RACNQPRRRNGFCRRRLPSESPRGQTGTRARFGPCGRKRARKGRRNVRSLSIPLRRWTRRARKNMHLRRGTLTKRKNELGVSRASEKKNIEDVALIAVVALYALFGVVMVYSASSYNAQVLYGDEFYFFRKQLFGYVIGLIAMIGAGFFDYRKLYSVK